jgi:Spy/CpxP family protein refolding chaperone
MRQMPCMAASDSGSMAPMMGMRSGEKMGDMMGAGMSGMMHDGQMGMMKQRMGHMFFLDRVEELGLSSEQVSKLKAIHVECREDNIRNVAKTKIARLDLSELLSGDTWTLEEAEPLVRMVQKLEGDIRVRHLQAVSDARKVLTAEQLKQAQTSGSVGNLENLFQ